MNIFYLHKDPETCAQMHCDQHVVKMILEYAQMLSTAHRVYGGEDERLYKVAHLNHPSTIWARSHTNNYLYLRDLFFYLCFEYTIRYRKIHKTQDRLEDVLFDLPADIPSGESEIPQCMPAEYKHNNPIVGYRNFYRCYKVRFATYKFTSMPEFMK